MFLLDNQGEKVLSTIIIQSNRSLSVSLYKLEEILIKCQSVIGKQNDMRGFV